MTKQNGVDVWPNAAIWMQDELRSKVRTQPFDAHCCHMGTTIKHPVPDRVKPSIVICDIRAL